MNFTGNVRLVSLGGSTAERTLGRSVVAESKVSIFLDSAEKKKICLDTLNDSDQRLAAGPGLYDWNFVLEESLPKGAYRVHFGVSWYDLDFFKNKKSIFKNSQHESIFSSFEITENDIDVSHWIREIH